MSFRDQLDDAGHAASAAGGLTSRLSEPRDPPLRADHADDRELVANYRGEVLQFVASRLGDRHEADDVTQQTLQQALRKLDSFRGGNLRAWLLCLARHEIANRARARAGVQFVEFTESGLQHAERQPQTAPDCVQASCDAKARIESCLFCMANRLRMAEEVAVLLSDVHGYADQESAARLRMTLASFKFLLHRARRRLHRAAADEQPLNLCPLVSKAGVRRACAGHALVARATARSPGDVRPSGLDETSLTTLHRLLVAAMGLGDDGAREVDSALRNCPVHFEGSPDVREQSLV